MQVWAFTNDLVQIKQLKMQTEKQSNKTKTTTNIYVCVKLAKAADSVH